MTKGYVIRGAGYLAKIGVTRGQAYRTGMKPNQEVNIAEELTYLLLSIDIRLEWMWLTVKHSPLEWSPIRVGSRLVRKY